MKIAVVMRPKSGECELLVKGQPQCRPRFVVLSRGRVIVSMLVAMACTAGLIAGLCFCAWFEASHNDGTQSENEQKAKRQFVAAELVERSAVVRPFDEQSLKKGDVIVLRANSFSSPKVQQIAATPNDTVVIRRGGALESLYMIGTNGFVVVGDREPTRLVRTEEITGTLVGGSAK